MPREGNCERTKVLWPWEPCSLAGRSTGTETELRRLRGECSHPPWKAEPRRTDGPGHLAALPSTGRVCSCVEGRGWNSGFNRQTQGGARAGCTETAWGDWRVEPSDQSAAAGCAPDRSRSPLLTQNSLKRLKCKTWYHKNPRWERRQNILWHRSCQCFLGSVSQDSRNTSKNK